MISDLEGMIIFEGREYTGIQELGVNKRGDFVVSLWTTPLVPEGEPRGSFFTVIPISNMEYRREHPTGAGYSILEIGKSFLFKIFTDYGQSSDIILRDVAMASELEMDCLRNEIPKESVR